MVEEKKENIDQAQQEIDQVLKKHHCELIPQYSFPQYQGKLPDEIVLALRILESRGMKILISLSSTLSHQKKS